MKKLHSFFSRSLGCILLLLTVLAEGWLIYGVRINSDPPVVREYKIESDKISSPVTIVMLSDLHGCEHPTLIGQVAVDVLHHGADLFQGQRTFEHIDGDDPADLLQIITLIFGCGEKPPLDPVLNGVGLQAGDAGNLAEHHAAG